MIGEFSGFYKNLKKGFELHGHNVTLMASGDGWKRIEGADILIDSNWPYFLGKIHKRIQIIFSLIKLSRFDVALIVNPNIGLSLISKLFSFILKLKSKKIILSACGTDLEYLKYGEQKKFDYWPYDVNKPKLSNIIHKNILDSVNFIIPTFYDYAEPWRQSIYSKNVLTTIPLPIDTDSIKPFFPKDEDKITFFHGLNREDFKGTGYIKKALLNIEKEFSHEIEVIIDGKMPLNVYLELIKKVDVVLDQCKVYSFASMNSLYSMSMGKVIMSGYREECKKEYNIESELPGILHIEPSVEQIESQLRYIIKNKHKLRSWGKINRQYVENFHDVKTIASRYITLFEKNSIC